MVCHKGIPSWARAWGLWNPCTDLYIIKLCSSAPVLKYQLSSSIQTEQIGGKGPPGQRLILVELLNQLGSDGSSVCLWSGLPSLFSAFWNSSTILAKSEGALEFLRYDCLPCARASDICRRVLSTSGHDVFSWSLSVSSPTSTPQLSAAWEHS